VHVARGVLTPGEPVGPDQLAVAEVRLSTASLEHYLRADEPVPDGLVAARVVGDGELVPRTALVDPSAVDVRPVAIPLDAAPSGDLAEGSTVDLWVTAEPEDGVPVEPEPLSAALVVAEVARPEGAFASSGATVVQVLVPVADLPGVLGALAGESAVHVVPVPGG